MPIDLYYVPGSAPCRAVQLTAKAVGVELDLKYTDLMSGEQLKPEYIKINPQHTVPTLVDNGFAVWESRAIMCYLADQYAKDDDLYPKEPKRRAVVNQRLYFDMGTLYQAFADYYYPMYFGGAPPDAAKLAKIETAMEFLDTFLEGEEYTAGPTLTLADLTLVATVSTYEIVEYDLTPYKNVVRWLAKMKEAVIGYQEANHEGLIAFKELVAKLRKK